MAKKNKKKGYSSKSVKKTNKIYLSLSIVSLINRMERLSTRVGENIRFKLLELIQSLKNTLRLVKKPKHLKISKKKFKSIKPLDRKQSKQIATKNLKQMTSKIFSSMIQYCIPVLSVGFLIATVRYTVSLEYDMNISTYQEELSSVAQVQTQQILERSIPNTAEEIQVDITEEIMPRFSFKSIEDEVKAMGGNITEDTSSTENSTSINDNQKSLSEGYGIFVENEFLGAVKDKSSIESSLNDILNEYLSMDNVTEAHFTNQVVYTKGLYLTDYMLEPDTIIKTLTGNKQEDIYYTIEEGDSLSLIAEITDLSIEEILELNPQITNPNLCKVGEEILIQKAEPFLDVEYTKSIVETVEIPFNTTTQEDDTLLIGEQETLKVGEIGTKEITTEYNYINDVQTSTNTSEKILKEPINEVIAIGTAEPVQEVTEISQDIPVMNYNVQEISTDTKFIRPVDGGYISDTFISNRNHKGIDIAVAYGTPIYASADGTVTSCGWNDGGYGYFVMIDHGNGYATMYAHMSKILVTTGQSVVTGETIGKVGSTGNSTGNHLHFEVRYNNICQNPEDYIIDNY